MAGGPEPVIDAVAGWPHLADHLIPIWRALPEEQRGVFWAGGKAVAKHVTARGVQCTVGLPHHEGPPTLVANHHDLTQTAARRPVVYVEHGAGQTYCLTPAMRILTQQMEWVSVDGVKVGDAIVAFDEHGPNREWREAHITDVARRVLPCYRLHLADGSWVDASADHRWLTRDRQMWEWSTTSKLQPASLFPRRSSKLCRLFDTWEHDESWGAGYLAAAFDGEGCFTQTPRAGRQNRAMLAFTQRPNEMLDRVEVELTARGFEFTRTERASDGVAHLYVRGGRREAMRFLGAIRPFRLLRNMVALTNGQLRGTPVELVDLEPLGEREVVALATSTGTLVAEGFASHNSDLPWHPSYSGGLDRQRVRLFLTLNDVTAGRERAAYPDAAVAVVGSAHLDDLEVAVRSETVQPASPPVAVFCFHWDCPLVEETRETFTWWRRTLLELDRSGRWQVVVHAHPRFAGVVERWALKAGVGYEPNLAAALAEAGVVAVDNSSVLYEAAALGIPVVALNHPRYRRHVHHGLRFWDMVPGPQVDRREELEDRLTEAAGSEWAARRDEIASVVYPPETRGIAPFLAAQAVLTMFGG